MSKFIRSLEAELTELKMPKKYWKSLTIQLPVCHKPGHKFFDCPDRDRKTNRTYEHTKKVSDNKSGVPKRASSVTLGDLLQLQTHPSTGTEVPNLRELW